MSSRVLKALPGSEIVFLGVFWNDGWEFDGPCALYSPVHRLREGGNSGVIDSLVENLSFDLEEGKALDRAFSAHDLKECGWREWAPRGFRRREGSHVRIVVRFEDTPEGLRSHVVSREERFGRNPFASPSPAVGRSAPMSDSSASSPSAPLSSPSNIGTIPS